MPKRKNNKSFPEYVIPYNIPGNSIIQKNGRYYLYRILPEGAREYIGALTEEKGLVLSKRQKKPEAHRLILTKARVYEYGFSQALMALCPENWKKDLGDDWEPLLTEIILAKSPDSFLTRNRKKKLKRKRYYAAQSDKLTVLLSGKNVSLPRLFSVMSPLKLIAEENVLKLTIISDEQRALCEEYGISWILEGREAL